MPKRKSEHTGNRIWIELEEPKSSEHAELQCTLANRMLKRLSPTTSMAFWWSADARRYCLTVDSAGCYVTLPDRGEWFNLDHLGREGE